MARVRVLPSVSCRWVPAGSVPGGCPVPVFPRGGDGGLTRGRVAVLDCELLAEQDDVCILYPVCLPSAFLAFLVLLDFESRFGSSEKCSWLCWSRLCSSGSPSVRNGSSRSLGVARPPGAPTDPRACPRRAAPVGLGGWPVSEGFSPVTAAVATGKSGASSVASLAALNCVCVLLVVSPAFCRKKFAYRISFPPLFSTFSSVCHVDSLPRCQCQSPPPPPRPPLPFPGSRRPGAVLVAVGGCPPSGEQRLRFCCSFCFRSDCKFTSQLCEVSFQNSHWPSGHTGTSVTTV